MGEPAPDLPAIAASCPVERSIWLIGGRWKLLVLRALLVGGPQGYNDLLRMVDGISPKELTRNLRELEAADLVARTAGEGARQRAAYALTPLGASLNDAFRLLGEFGQRYADQRGVRSGRPAQA